MRRATVPLAVILDANAEGRGLAIELAIPRKLQRVSARVHRSTLIAHAAKRDEIGQADGSPIGQVDELEITLKTTQTIIRPRRIQAELDRELWASSRRCTGDDSDTCSGLAKARVVIRVCY